MLITKADFDKINQVRKGDPYSPFFNPLSALTERAIREVLAPRKEQMELSDAEEEVVQRFTAAQIGGSPDAVALHQAIVKLIRTRHVARVIAKSPGRRAHEAFHSHLSSVGSSKYGNGCWNEMSDDRKEAWEKAAAEVGK